ncbi:MAG: CoA ester lyase [Rhizobiaceae bacterium]
MRSLLFCPGDSERKLEKAFASGADVVIVDLEDSVSPENKATARRVAPSSIRALRAEGGPKVYVRVNDLTTGMTAADVAAVVSAGIDGIMLPKAVGAADTIHLAVMLRVAEAEAGVEDGSTGIIPIITETAAALLAGATWTHQPRLAGLTWGAEDLSASIGARVARGEDGRYLDVFRYARMMALLAAGAADVAAIDTVFPDFRDERGFARDCVEAERDGFTAKMAIHPAQVPVINAAFTPSTEAVEQSRAVIEAFEMAGNPGVLAIGGKMYDRPHLRLAERLLARARAAGRA